MKIPIRARLTITFTAILMVVIGVLELAGYLSVRAAIHALVDHELNTRLAGIEDHVERHVNRYHWPKTGTDLAVHPAFQPSLLTIRSGSGETLFEGDAMVGLTPPVSEGFSTGDGRGDALRILSIRRIIKGEPYSLLLGTSLQMPSGILRRLWLLMLLSLPVLLLVSASLGYWMSGRALAPIQEIVMAARSIDSRRLSQRVPVPATGDEVQQLAETFNGMLERIESGFQKMREFTANASHELRTPVAIVRAAAEVALLRPRATETYYRETLERVLRESERNSALLESMLELARVDSGTDSAHREWLSVSESLSDACEQVAPLAAARRITLRFQPCAGETGVLGDAEQLRRLWLILLDNAIKYTPSGGAVNARATVTPEGDAIAEILDSGIGIAPEHQALIFERFYRTDKARTRALGGAGLGLAIAREITAIHEADIEVESRPGGGSRFFVTFQTAAARAASSPILAEGQTVR